MYASIASLPIQRATISVVGLAGGLMTLPIFALAMNSVTVTGTYVGTQRDMQDMMAAYTKHKVHDYYIHQAQYTRLLYTPSTMYHPHFDNAVETYNSIKKPIGLRTCTCAMTFVSLY
jgi:hypothetical protein